jgi:hypothetical protein
VLEAYGDIGGTLHDMPVGEDVSGTVDLKARTCRRDLFATFALEIFTCGLSRGHSQRTDEHHTRRVAMIDLANSKPVLGFTPCILRDCGFLHGDCCRR